MSITPRPLSPPFLQSPVVPAVPFLVTTSTLASAPKVYTLSDIRVADFPPPTPIVEGLLNEGETIALVGKPKVGKSRLAQQLTLSLSRAEPYLGMPVRTARKVFYCDLENRPTGVKSRFAQLSAPHPNDANVFVYAPETLVENVVSGSDDGIQQLADFIRSFRPDVLIIDPWRLFVGGDGNNEEQIMGGLKALSELRCILPSLALIIIHHLRKGRDKAEVNLRHDPSVWVEAASGHYSLIGHTDATYGLQRERTSEGEELIVFGGVARSISPPMLLLEEDPQSLSFRLAEGEQSVDKLFTPVEKQIWTAARSLAGAFTFSGLVRAANTTNQKAVTRALRKAEQIHLLAHEGNLYRVVPGAAELPQDP